MTDNFDKVFKQMFIALFLTTKAISIHAQAWTEIRHSNIFTLSNPNKVLKKQFTQQFFIFKKATKAVLIHPSAAKELTNLFGQFPLLFDSLIENSTIKIEKDNLAIFETNFVPLGIEKAIAIITIEKTSFGRKIIWRLTLFGHTNPCFEEVEISGDNFTVRNAGCEI